MKLCKDCKHVETWLSEAHCNHPSTLKDLVYGRPMWRCADARVGRNFNGREICGPQGKLFEPREAEKVETPPPGTVQVINAEGKVEWRPMSEIIHERWARTPALVGEMWRFKAPEQKAPGKPTMLGRIASYFRWIYQR